MKRPYTLSAVGKERLLCNCFSSITFYSTSHTQKSSSLYFSVHCWQYIILVYFQKVNRWSFIYASLKTNTGGAVLRWQRNRTGRPLSPPQIHQKNIWMLSKFHKQLLNGSRKAAHCLRKEVGKIIKDRETKKVRTEIHPGKGVLKKRGFQTPGNTLTGESVASLGTSEGNITGEKK